MNLLKNNKKCMFKNTSLCSTTPLFCILNDINSHNLYQHSICDFWKEESIYFNQWMISTTFKKFVLFFFPCHSLVIYQMGVKVKERGHIQDRGYYLFLYLFFSAVFCLSQY